MSTDQASIRGERVDPSTAARVHAQAVVERSGTSFYWGMRLLPRPKREAMFAVYAFCREVDDVADGDGSSATKLNLLARWRDELDALFAGRPALPTSRALLEPIRRFDLPRREFELMIEGMEMDASGLWSRPQPEPALRAYCRCVAGAVGMLSVRIFGARSADADRGAEALGEAFQLTNILRDLDEDAAIGRIYLPAERLARHGIRVRDGGDVVTDPAVGKVCEELAALAEERFIEADRAFASTDRRCLRPILIMQAVYRLTLERLRARGFERRTEPIRIGKPERVWLALRHGLL
jgi:phytoene synthase